MHMSRTIGAWWATQGCTVPTPPRCLPAPDESIQCCESGIRIGNSFSISSTSGARPNGHHGNPNAFMPAEAGRPPMPSVLIE